MKKILLTPVVLFAIWSAYWVIGKNTLMGAFAEAQTDLREDGIELSAANIKVKGYPLGYQAALNDVSVKSDNSQYSAELINIKASALKPTVWTLTADKPVHVKMRGNDGQPYDFILAGEEMRVELGSSVTGKLKSVHAVMRGLKAVAAPNGLAPPVIGIETGELSISPSAAPLQEGMSTHFDFSGVRLGHKAGGDLQRAFGPLIPRVHGTGLAAGLASLEADDVAKWQTNGAITVPDFALDWGKTSFLGEVDLDLSATPTSGENGVANGAATLGVTDANALIQAFVEAGMLTQGQALAGSFLLMAAPVDAKGNTVLTFPVQDNALTLFGQTLHKF